VNGETGKLQDMKELGVWDTYSVKAQTVKTAIEVIHIRDFLIPTQVKRFSSIKIMKAINPLRNESSETF
jgi:hypothetical protein